MRHSAWIVVLAAAAALGSACNKKTPPRLEPTPPPAPSAPPPAPVPPPRVEVPQISEYDKLKQTPIDELERMGLLGDIHFDYDKSDVREGDRQLLAKNADTLKKYDFLRITLEGHCDERGSVEYNLALGERRAKAAYDYLLSLGVGADRMKTVSYGKEVPVCQQSTEECWGRNRRAHFGITGKK